VSLFQVSVDVENPATLERETRSLLEAMDELDMKEAAIINLDDKRDLKHVNKTIHVLPAYAWFLDT
jgi:hypothetical protein